MRRTRSFLKWAGSKYQLVDKILSMCPSTDRLIEPFAGSAVIFMNAEYPSYLLTEVNQELINLFQFIQQEGDSFIQYCQGFFNPVNNQRATYHAFRDEFNQCKEPRHRAALFLYLNRHGYNGLCRFNQKGIYNVPFGSYSKPYFPKLELDLFYKKSQRAVFMTRDFKETFAMARSGDLIYCDPPYVPIEQASNFSSYTQQKFTEDDHITLAQLAKETAQRGITVLISNHDTPFTRRQYQDAQIVPFTVRRQISCVAKNRGGVKELVAIFHG